MPSEKQQLILLSDGVESGEPEAAAIGAAQPSAISLALKGQSPARRRFNLGLLLSGLLLQWSLVGCGNAVFAVQSGAAASRIEEAQELGAKKLAPYEYYLALEYLKKARQEAAEADYGDAIELASDSEAQAEKAIRLSKDAHRSAGR